jgi:dipeptidase D
MRVNGGTKNNAIPREAQAALLFSGETDQKEISQAVRTLHETIHAEYQVTDPGLTISSSWQDTDPREKKTVFIKRDTRRILRFLMSVPDGLIEYMPGFDRMPQTSLNFGVLATAADGIEATFLVRSALNSQREMMNDRLRCIAAQFDGKVDVKGSYPAWEYRFHSDFRDMLADLYEKTTGKKALVCVTHGGLECAIMGAKYPNWEMVSIGPTIMYPHSPDERLKIDTVDKCWKFLVAVLENIPKK